MNYLHYIKIGNHNGTIYCWIKLPGNKNIVFVFKTFYTMD